MPLGSPVHPPSALAFGVRVEDYLYSRSVWVAVPLVDLRSLKAEKPVLSVVSREGNEYSWAPVCTLHVLLPLDALSHLILIHLFSKQLRSACYAPGIVLDTVSIAGSQTDKTFPAIIEFTFYVEMGRHSK